MHQIQIPLIKTYDLTKKSTNYRLAHEGTEMDKLDYKVVEDWKINSDDLKLIQKEYTTKSRKRVRGDPITESQLSSLSPRNR